MKNIFSKVLMALAAIVMTGAITGCHEADPEFMHTDNLISKLTARPDVGKNSKSYDFVITEYDANGKVVTDSLTAEKVYGGYGEAVVTVPITDWESIDLTNVYLQAELTYDAVIINGGLVGPHDIQNLDAKGKPQGITIYVKAGNGNIRPYKVVGIYK